MFRVVTERRKRRVWSPRTIAASVVFHLLLLAGFVSAAANTTPERIRVDELTLIPPETPRVVRPTPPPPAPTPPAADKPTPVKGQTVQLPAPERVPDKLPEVDPHATPLTPDQVTGLGRPGDVFGPPDPTPKPPAGTTEPQPESGNGAGDVLDASSVTTLPEMANKREAERMLQRAYPPLMRDAGITGHTMVMLIIDAEGKVEPGSVRVQDSTHDAFRDAAVRAAERFRFRPATLHGHPVSVLIAIPIDWRLEN